MPTITVELTEVAYRNALALSGEERSCIASDAFVAKGQNPAAPAANESIADADVDTRNAWELIEALEKAQEIAERVDAARGNALPGNIPILSYQTRGTDLAKAVAALAARVQGEINEAYMRKLKT
jgi:hypothetical protein